MRDLEINLQRNRLKELIDLDAELKDWYQETEIKIGKNIFTNILDNLGKLKIKVLNKNALIGTIDYTLNEIFFKNTTQKKIAERHHTSSASITNYRSIIAPYVPQEYIYPLFISEEDLRVKKEKTYLFKVYYYYYIRSWIKLELLESNTLDDFHDAIHFFIDGEDFFDDHLYSFFLNGNIWDPVMEYAGPPDFQMVERNGKLTDVPLNELNLGYKQKFVYLYDYGDQITYDIILTGYGVRDDNKTYPNLVR